jgi:hypothetical protein
MVWKNIKTGDLFDTFAENYHVCKKPWGERDGKKKA